jgi:hypothetical protein
MEFASTIRIARPVKAWINDNQFSDAPLNREIPAPNAMIIPSVFFPRENLEAISPPRIKEEVASRPHKNATNILKDFKLRTNKK